MTDLRAIAVRVNDYGRGPGSTKEDDDGHVGINLEPAAYSAYEDEECTPREWWLACLDVAGVLGRVAVGLAPFIAESAHRHRCVRLLGYSGFDEGVFDAPHLSGCELSGSEETLRPGTDMGYYPALWLRVPREDVPAWLQRVRELLEAIAQDANDLQVTFPPERHDEHALTSATATDHGSTSELDGTTTVGALRLVARGSTTGPASPADDAVELRRHDL